MWMGNAGPCPAFWGGWRKHPHTGAGCIHPVSLINTVNSGNVKQFAEGWRLPLFALRGRMGRV